MVRPLDWIEYNTKRDGLAMVGSSELNAAPEVKRYLQAMNSDMRKNGIYPVKDAIDLTTTILQTVMDVNLTLQLQKSPHTTQASFAELAPEVLTLCSGALDPFDFAIDPGQHYDLYLAGQLCVHLQAALLE